MALTQRKSIVIGEEDIHTPTLKQGIDLWMVWRTTILMAVETIQMAEKVPVGPRIVALRERSRLSQTEVARAAGVDKATLNRIERGKNLNPLNQTLGRIATALGVTLSDLLDPKTSTRGEFGATALPAGLRVLFEAMDDKIDESLAIAREARKLAREAKAAATLAESRRRGRRSV